MTTELNKALETIQRIREFVTGLPPGDLNADVQYGYDSALKDVKILLDGAP